MATETDPSSRVYGPGLGVGLRLHSDCAVLALHGELDCATVARLDDALINLPESVARVVLNMAEVTFMDTAGLHFLERLQVFGVRCGIPTEAVRFRRQPRRVLDLNRACGWPAGATGPPAAPSADAHVLALVHARAPDAAAVIASERESAAERTQRLEEENQQLRRALDSRPVIDQASA